MHLFVVVWLPLWQYLSHYIIKFKIIVYIHYTVHWISMAYLLFIKSLYP